MSRMQELVAEYNALTGKTIKKFENLAKGEAAVAKARAAAPAVVETAAGATVKVTKVSPANGAAKPAPADPLGTLVKEVTKPVAKKAPASDATLYKVADDSKVKRGAFRKFVDRALKLGKFTRAGLLAKAKDDPAAAYEFGYAVRHGIFKATK